MKQQAPALCPGMFSGTLFIHVGKQIGMQNNLLIKAFPSSAHHWPHGNIDSPGSKMLTAWTAQASS